MKKLLDSLNRAGKHLSILDKTFKQNYPTYAEIHTKLQNLPLYDELRKEIYAGGKRGGIYGYARQMILGDLLQYIFIGRGYYFSVRGDEQRAAFLSMLMYVCNLLIVMEDISVNVKLRNKILDSLKLGIGTAFFEDDDQEEIFDDLRKYKGFITPKEKDSDWYDDILDSMLPKRVGVIPELLVYAHLLRKNYGYVVPLLHAQRLLGNDGFVVPPDFLLLRSKGEIFGIEVGGGKEQQMGSFSTVTTVPVFVATIGDPRQTQPFRCGKCLRWITYCDEVIRLCSTNREPDAQYVDCAECSFYASLDEALENCPNIVYHGRATDHYGDVRELRYHYICVRKDPELPKVLERARTPKLIAPIPWVSGLRYLKQDI